eukprot:CAMPEP_0206044028 /NCGR_PEP_ID=MMETSP1466-20131121/11350_1 /ASSEMBLY_ACC=CAM_ASM_001126 /TAXON_ID=44452 /ORGANISM="Pavlova gyrans, Strain CCMP608" /LENGTH=567 /DNA_ID=CAMNT_0053418907 /DNA_START=24 /DNA_END=1727 /DNA_ORIENTATION=+
MTVVDVEAEPPSVVRASSRAMSASPSSSHRTQLQKPGSAGTPTPSSASVIGEMRIIRDPNLTADLQERRRVSFDPKLAVPDNHVTLHSPPPRAQKILRSRSSNERVLMPTSPERGGKRVSAMIPFGGANVSDIATMVDGSDANNQRLRELAADKSSLVDANALRLVRKLGEGSYGLVFKCKLALPEGHPAADLVEGGGGFVAVKRIKSNAQIAHADRYHTLTTEEIREFAAEMLIMKRLRHPNIVGFVGSGLFLDEEGHDQLGLVLEFARHGSLRELLDAGNGLARAFSVTEGLRWTHHVAAGLAFLHECKPPIVHRDLKPENVLICGPHRTAKLADFGLATFEMKRIRARIASAAFDEARGRGEEVEAAKKLAVRATADFVKPFVKGADDSDPDTEATDPFADTPEVPKPTRESRASRQGEASESGPSAAYRLTGQTGSLIYMAPENYRGEAYTHTVDQYSFGILAYELLRRERAYIDTYLSMAMIAQEAAGKRQLRPKLPSKWPAPVKELLQRCWHADADVRPDFKEVAGTIATWRETPDAGMMKAIAAGTSKGMLEIMRIRKVL